MARERLTKGQPLWAISLLHRRLGGLQKSQPLWLTCFQRLGHAWKFRGLRHSISNCVNGCLGASGELDLRKDSGDVILYRLFGKQQLAADFLIGMPECDQPDDFALANG